jgi:hypothetical protein
MLAHHPTPKLEDHPLSIFRDYLFNISAATQHIGGRSSIRNLRMRHAVVTGTHWSWCVFIIPVINLHLCQRKVLPLVIKHNGMSHWQINFIMCIRRGDSFKSRPQYSEHCLVEGVVYFTHAVTWLKCGRWKCLFCNNLSCIFPGFWILSSYLKHAYWGLTDPAQSSHNYKFIS